MPCQIDLPRDNWRFYWPTGDGYPDTQFNRFTRSRGYVKYVFRQIDYEAEFRDGHGIAHAPLSENWDRTTPHAIFYSAKDFSEAVYYARTAPLRELGA